MATNPQETLFALAQLIQSRQSANDEHSYTAQRLQGEKERLLKKVGEEAVEVILAASQANNQQAVIYVLYHLMVTWAREGITLQDISIELARRFTLSGLAEKAARNHN